jgi:putative FmdB family regulatory protein
MPVYDYVCRACGHRMEVIHGMHVSGPTDCDVCGGPLRRALTAPAIVFKGSGWAKKDARAAARPKDAADRSDRVEAGDGKVAAAATGDARGDRDKGSSGDEPTKPAAQATKESTPPGKGSGASSGSHD